MKLTHPLLVNIAGLVVSSLVRRWMDTIDCRWALYDRSVDPALDVPGRHRIYLFWHEYMMAPLDRRGRSRLTMLLSRHRDADIAARVAGHYGLGVVRGSTYHGAARSLRELIDVSQRGHLTITPDGPRGPRRVMAVGPIYLASKLGLPIVPLGVGYDRPWRVNSWDRFAVPRPFSRARGVLGPELWVPPNLDRAGLGEHRVEVERIMNLLTLDAEAWAESGTRKEGEVPIAREIFRRGNYQGPASQPPDTADQRRAA